VEVCDIEEDDITLFSYEKNWNGMEFFNFFHMKKIEMLFLLYGGW